MQNATLRAPSVRIAFRTFGRTLRHSYDNLVQLGIASLLWVLCTLPVLVLFVLAAWAVDGVSVFWPLAALLTVGIGPPTAALHRITQRMSEERASNWQAFWGHLRSDWRWSSRLSWTLLFGLLLWEANRRFYSQSPNTTLQLISGFFLVVVIVWWGVMLYATPLALRQTEQSLRTTFRNAGIIVLANLPGVLVSLVLLFFTSLLLSILPPLFLLVPGWVALWSEENVRLLLVASGQIPPDEFADSPRRSR